MLTTNSFTDKELKFKAPFGMVISGPSSSGKSTFLLKFIAECPHLIHPPPDSVLYCFGEMSSIVPLLQQLGVNVYAGVPPPELIKRQRRPLLLILDDLLLSIDEGRLSSMFLKESHHQAYSVIFVTQSLFERKLKVARQNAQYLILMRAPNSALSIRTIGTQLFPRRLDYFLAAYREATRKPYGYLLVDMHASSDPLLRLRTGIFKNTAEEEEEEHSVFIPKDGLP